MKYQITIGIDPALRDNGMAVAFLSIKEREIKTCRFRDYNHFVRYMFGAPFHTVKNVAIPDAACLRGAFVVLEDANENRATFRGKQASQNKYASNSRDIGKNMSICTLAIKALTEAGANVYRLAPSKKPKWPLENVPQIVRQDGYTWLNETDNDDERWAVVFALFGVQMQKMQQF